MRIAQVIESVPQSSGGTTTAFLGTLAALDAAGLEWRAFARDPGADDPVHAEIAPMRPRWTLAKADGHPFKAGDLARVTTAALERREVDLIHLHGVWSAEYLAITNVCRRLRVPYVWEPHGMLLHDAVAQKRWKKELFLTFGGRSAIAQTSSLLFVTSHERDHSYVPKQAKARCDVVPLAVPTPDYPATGELREASRRKLGLSPDDPVVVSIGRLHPVKRIELLIEAVAALGGSVGHAQLMIVGDGEPSYVSSLRKLAANRLGDRAVFTGWLKGEDKWAALAAADALSLQSVHENFGFVAVEALWAGTMPVLTENLALAQELSDARLCTVSAEDAPSLARAIEVGLRERDRDELRSRGLAFVAEHFSPRAIGHRLGAIYRRILEGSRP